MRKSLCIAAAAGLLVSLPLAAEAFPIAGPTATSLDSRLTLVAGGCGPDMQRGPLGHCRPMPIVRTVIRRPVVCRIVGLIPHRVCRRF